MYHRRTAVGDDPFPVVLAFDAGFAKAPIAHLVTHTRRQGLGLAVGRTRSDDHTFKQGGEMFGVENPNVLGLDVLQCVDNHALEFLDVFPGGGLSHQWGFLGARP